MDENGSTPHLFQRSLPTHASLLMSSRNSSGNGCRNLCCLRYGRSNLYTHDWSMPSGTVRETFPSVYLFRLSRNRDLSLGFRSSEKYPKA
ncbi:MAG: hypothetical protein WC375_04175 [Methanomassiliicoccales archaeon]